MTELPSDVAGYPTFGLRFRALLIDSGICAGVYFICAISAAVLFEQHPAGRIVTLMLIVGFVIGYEPIMVSRYGATVGHRSLNIYVVDAKTHQNLPFWRALIRSLIKQVFGTLSFVFMAVTRKAQGLHDFVAGSEVRIRDPHLAVAADYFVPAFPSPRLVVSPLRRVGFIVLHNVLIFVALSVFMAVSVSETCMVQGACSPLEHSVQSVIGLVWLVLIAISTSMGWTGRLPGCRKRIPPVM